MKNKEETKKQTKSEKIFAVIPKTLKEKVLRYKAKTNMSESEIVNVALNEFFKVKMLKEDVDDGVEYDPSKDDKILSEDEVVEEDELQDGYTEETDDEEPFIEKEEDVELDDGKDELFEDLGDEGEEMLYGNDLANDNLDNDDDIIE